MQRVALLIVMLSGVWVAVAVIPTGQPIEGAYTWMRSLSQAERAFYLQDSVLRALPLEYRRVLLGSITKGASRAAFWRAAFATYRNRNLLTPRQIAALDHAIILLTPEAMDGSAASVKAMRTIEAQLYEAFGPAAAAELTYMDIADAGSAALPIPERFAYEWRRLRARVGASTGLLAAGREVNCNCNTTGDCKGPGNWQCNTSSCTPAITGDCGPFVECTKYCVEQPQ